MDAPSVLNHDSDSEIDYEAEEDDNQQDSLDENDEEDSEDEIDEDEDAAWKDEDDKRLKISLTASNITKKLRTDVDEDIIDGVEYTRRLRKQ
jgi:U3 small nucleolar RNA-associated protein 18